MLKLTAFLILSISAHGALVVLWSSTASETRHLPQSEAQISTVYVTASTPAPNSNNKNKTDIKEKNLTAKVKTQEKEILTTENIENKNNDQDSSKNNPIQNNQANSPENISEQVALLGKPENKPQSNTHKKQRVKILSHIKDKVNLNFTYPALAVRKQWQGRVLLNFSISSDGRIQNIHVKQSSGYGVLDNSALSNLKKVGDIDALKLDIEIDKLDPTQDFELPIEYRLTGPENG